MLAVVLVLLLMFAGRLVQVQVIDGAALAEQARSQRERTYTVHASRGEIVDADGFVLATSVVRYDVVVDQRQVPAYVRYGEDNSTVEGRGASAAAAALAPLLGVSEHELGATLTGTAGYKVIATDVTPEVRQQVMDLGINGLTTEQKTKRVYPGGSTAGSIVGWVNDTDGDGTLQGAAGLESRFDDVLTGTNGSRTVEIGVGGTVIPGAAQTVVAARDGETVHTTLDLDLQQQCQQVIDAKKTETGAEWAAATVVDVKTGEVLALCESDMIDPNAPTGFGKINAVQSPYEPGSTGKILTVAAAMEEGLISPTSDFDVPYRYTTPNGQVFKDHTEHPDERLTVAGILADSSNTGTIQIGSLMSDATRAKYMQAFGWDEPSGVELAGESGGYNLDPDGWDGRTKYASMFGQGVAVDLLQNVNVIATLGNGGVRNQLHLVSGFTDSSGTFTPQTVADPVRVVSPETADQMLLMLESVTSADGATGNRAAIDGYRVAGKTGTAQVANTTDGRLTDSAASFVGVVPADDPQIAVGVIIYRPQHGFFGGTIAAPVFHDIASFALSTLGIPPTGVTEPLYPLTPGGDMSVPGYDG
ncbi:peptidoglycan D,D-transpeptidase FtsI family protein [Miniimonas arenae]|uniref:peptidoglycan D,D-transpeptidase FtsI family protein n=1 Tax=Miniimonas arenae TaxID=676201 RepID=UPI0028A7280A|nr:penicillin-binding protein 2 [Miniimonas arenae]